MDPIPDLDIGHPGSEVLQSLECLLIQRRDELSSQSFSQGHDEATADAEQHAFALAKICSMLDRIHSIKHRNWEDLKLRMLLRQESQRVRDQALRYDAGEENIRVLA